jgi:hypothetical protein
MGFQRHTLRNPRLPARSPAPDFLGRMCLARAGCP